MLTRLEDAFKKMKSHLGFRPIFHQKECRADAHLFISVLAYRVLHFIEYTLRKNGDTRSWWSIRNSLKTHQSFTLNYDELSEDQHWIMHHVRLCSEPEESHLEIYKSLNIKPVPFQKKAISYQM